MSDQEKQGTPPPLLLMGTTGGSSWNAPQGASLFMPVPHSDPPLLTPEEGGEEDSFVGQSAVPAAPMSYFQPQASTIAADPFANVGHNPLPATQAASIISATPTRAPPTAVVPPSSHGVSSTVPPPSALPSFAPVPTLSGSSQVLPTANSSGLPPTLPASLPTSSASSSASNMFRHHGAMKYAQPPSGTYAASSNSGSSYLNPMQPPVSSTFQPLSAPRNPTSEALNPTTNFMPPPFSDSAKRPPPVPSARPSDVGIPSSYVTPGLQPGPSGPQVTYTPVQYHWFYSQNVELRQVWKPFSHQDSAKLENGVRAGEEIVSTDGGRYDVNVTSRTRHAVYWEEVDTRVRRCSWFYKLDGETKFHPYEEDFAEKIEHAYRDTLQSGEWHKRLEFPEGDSIVIHNPSVIVHFTASAQPDEWGTTSSDQMRPRVVRRGIEDINEDIAAGEPTKVDHVVFVVHGIGVTCDLRFRTIVECVDDLRVYSLQMGESHFKQHQDECRVGRVEYLPVRWHAALHGDATGVDRRLKAITLGSIGKLRHFTNDTLLDILFYSSPTYAQQIANTVSSELNRLAGLFRERNPTFSGGFSVCGHSLGSLILFDLLLHQLDPEDNSIDSLDGAPGATHQRSMWNGDKEKTTASTGESTPVAETSTAEEAEEEELSLEQVLAKLSLQEYSDTFSREQLDLQTLTMCSDEDLRELGIPLGPRKKLQGYIKLTAHKQKKKSEVGEEKKRKQLEERLAAEAAKQRDSSHSNQPSNVRDPLLRQASNTCVTYVQGAAGIGIPFVQYPRLDFQPAHFFALGSPIAMFLTVRGVDSLGDEFRFPTCPNFFNIFHPFDPVAYRLEPLIVSAYPPKPVLMPHHKGRKRLHLELRDSLTRMGADLKQRIIDSVKSTWQTLNSFAQAHKSDQLMEEEVDSAIQQLADEEDRAETESIASSLQEDDILVGNINQGRRIDYVLQEKPIESFNDYLFALASHLCYWESEDTVLLMMKEIYALRGIHPIKPGSQPHPPTAALAPPPMTGPSPSRLSPNRSRAYPSPSATTNFATSSPYMSASPQHLMTSTQGRGSPHSSPYSTSSPPPPMTGNLHSSQSAHVVNPGLVAPPAATQGFSGPPPLSGFVRKS